MRREEGNGMGRNDGGMRRDRGDFGGGRSNRGGGGFGSFPREMHKAVCAECQQECEVPFKPREGKPVYCRECYRNKQPAN